MPINAALNALPWWVIALVSILLTLIVMAAVLPDDWSHWISSRRNVPLELLPFGVVALLVGVVVLAWAFIQAMAFITVDPVVWLLLVAGILVILIWWFTRSYR